MNRYRVYLEAVGLTTRQADALLVGTEAETAWRSLSSRTLSPLPMMGDEKIAKVLEAHKDFSPKRYDATIERLGIRIALRDEEGDIPYPESLRVLSNPPGILFVRGGELPKHSHAVAVVGTRKPTEYARRVLSSLIPELVRREYTILSGGAYGVDTLAHDLAMRSNGRTIAVVGTGVDRAYPPENRGLFEKIIASGGSIVSQFPLGASAKPYHFPIRNELIAALSCMTIVPEAARESGSLITARLALDLGRDVYAVPGDIFRENSTGTNGLLESGEAAAIASVESFLRALDESRAHSTNVEAPASKHQSVDTSDPILMTLSENPETLDRLVEKTGIPLSELHARIAELELDTVIIRTPTGHYAIR